MIRDQSDQEFLDYLLVDRDLSEKWANSLINRKNKFLDWLEDHGYSQDPSEIPKIAFREYHNQMKMDLAPSTIRKRLSAINNWLDYHQENPTEDMKFRTPDQGRVNRPYYSQRQAGKLWRTSKEMGLKYHSLIALNLGMGLRRIGIYRQTWENLDLENRKATVIGKSKKQRDLIIPKKVRDILDSWRIKQAKRWGSCRYVMTKRGGIRPSRRKTLLDWLNKILDRAGVPKQDGFRGGRRRFGRDLYLATKDEVAVSQYLGHETTDQTRIYLELKDHDQKKAIDQLEKMRGIEVKP